MWQYPSAVFSDERSDVWLPKNPSVVFWVDDQSPSAVFVGSTVEGKSKWPKAIKYCWWFFGCCCGTSDSDVWRQEGPTNGESDGIIRPKERARETIGEIECGGRGKEKRKKALKQYLFHRHGKVSEVGGRGEVEVGSAKKCGQQCIVRPAKQCEAQ